MSAHAGCKLGRGSSRQQAYREAQCLIAVGTGARHRQRHRVGFGFRSDHLLISIGIVLQRLALALQQQAPELDCMAPEYLHSKASVCLSVKLTG